MVIVEGVSKRYRVYHDRRPTLKERLILSGRAKYEDRLVLNNVSFSVEPGKTVALIGSNGSGKSTLLKILAGIIDPTTGKARIDGRVSSLLELGAGFDPDFTGRENIYMNASIFGLTRKEIDAKYKAIVEFSELGDFINAPVRTYSSGMYIRLAFSVAINVDPDVMLVDEVLAVGDAHFQKKCMDQIHAIKRRGVTIIVVTHDMGAVKDLADEALWLDQGVLRKRGSAELVVDHYLRHVMVADALPIPAEVAPVAEPAVQPLQATSAGPSVEEPLRWGNKEMEILSIQFLTDDRKPSGRFWVREPITVEVRYRVNQRVDRPVFGVALYHQSGACVYGTNTDIDSVPMPDHAGEGVLRFCMPAPALLPGNYLIDVAIHARDGYAYDSWRQAGQFSIAGNTSEIGHTVIQHEWVFE